MKKGGLFLALVCFCASVEANTLTLQEVETSVDKHFPRIQAAKLEIQKAQAEYLSAKGGFDPTFRSRVLASPLGPYQNVYNTNEIEVPVTDTGTDIFAGYRLGRGRFAFYDQGKLTYPYGELNAGIKFPLLRDNKIDERRARIRHGEINISIKNEDLILERLETTRSASLAYWDWVSEGEKLKIQRKMLNLAIKRKSFIEQRYRAGDGPHIDIVENDQAIARRETHVENQLRLFQRASFFLSLYYRDERGNPLTPNQQMLPSAFTVSGDHEKIKPIGKKKIFNLAQHHPMMRRIGEQRENIFVDLSLARNEKKPVLNNRVFVAQDFGPSEFGANGIAPLNKFSIYYELNFEYPIFQRLARGMIKQAERSLDQLDAEQKLHFDQIKIGINDAINQLMIAKNVVNVSAREVRLAKKVEKAEVVRFDHGDSTLFLVNQREELTADAKMREVESVANYYKAKALLLYAMGFLPSKR